MTAQSVSSAAPTASLRDYLTLLKPGVMALVVFTGAVGMWLAPGNLHPLMQAVTILCIALGSGASGAFNMVYDRDMDAIMKRTQNRPIPAGRIASDDALVLAWGLSALSVGLLGLATNFVAAAWLAFAIFFYAVIYTIGLKRHTPHNIVIGGAAGAFPAVIGWAAMSGDVAASLPWVLFAIVFLWTPPHFWALCLYRHDDYARANVPMMPITHGVRHTKWQMLGYSIAMLGASLLPIWLHGAGLFYAVMAGGLGGVFVWRAWQVLKSDDAKVAMRFFGFSIMYLFALFAALVVDMQLIGAV